jgi:hypothetical protein
MSSLNEEYSQESADMAEFHEDSGTTPNQPNTSGESGVPSSNGAGTTPGHGEDQGATAPDIGGEAAQPTARAEPDLAGPEAISGQSGSQQAAAAGTGGEAAQPTAPSEPDLASREAALAERERLLAEREAAAQAAAPVKRPQTLRRVLVGILVVLTSIAVLVSAVTIWAHQTVLNTDRFVATIQPVISDPTVINTVSNNVANQVVMQANVQQRVKAALPPKADFLAAPITTAAQNLTQKVTSGVLSSKAFQSAWPTVVRKAHSQLVALLRGDTRNVVIENGQLQINLFPVIVDTLSRLQAAAPGLVRLKAPLPSDTAVKSPSVARQQLSAALGKQLPPTFGVIVIAESAQLDKAQQVVKAFDFLVIAIPVLTVVLAAIAIALSVDRRRTLIQLGIGIVIAFVLALLLIQAAEHRIYEAIASGNARDLVQVAVPALVQDLVNVAWLLVVVGALLAVAAYLAGRPAWLTGLTARLHRGTA